MPTSLSTGDIPAPGDHGGDAAHVARTLGLRSSDLVDLSASMNPFAPDCATLISEAIHRDPTIVGRYPDAIEATEVFAGVLGVDPALLVLTNGGAEAIALVASVVRRGNIVEPEFSLYRRHLEQVDAEAPRWRSNPSNPLGTLAESADTAAVWDEAFYAIATGAWTRGDVGSWRLGSLTKLWDCPGVRLGFVIAPTRADADRVRQLQPRWAVSGIALAVLIEMLPRTDLPGWAAQIAALRSDFVATLQALGHDAVATAANWVLIDRPGLRADLLQHGVLVRDCASFGLPGVHRIAVPNLANWAVVADAFAAVRPR